MLGRSLGLYRDLSVALSGQIAQLKAEAERAADGGSMRDMLKLFGRALTVIEDEAGLAERSRAGSGAGGALDLDAARAEILARLAVRDAAG